MLEVFIFPLVIFIAFSWLAYTQYERLFGQEENLQLNAVEVNTENKDEPKEILKEPEAPPKEESIEEETSETVEDEPAATEPTGSWWSYPTSIKDVTKSPSDLLVLVNKEYKLPSDYVPSDLVYTPDYGIRAVGAGNFYVRSIIIDDLVAMMNASKEAGLNISLLSAYRSYSTQHSAYNYWLNYNNGNTAAVDQISARPGHSQHQLGTAIDFSSTEIGDKLGAQFHTTASAKWLADNAWKYGFVISYPDGHEETTGYVYESWHYRYIGKENAANWKASGKVLEIWLREKNGL